jgi:small subunit ribosomal protein S12
MGDKPRGLVAGRRLKMIRDKYRLNKKRSKSYFYGVWLKYDPLEGAPQARGIVLEKCQIEPRKPNSGFRKCCKVQLIKNGKVVTAFMPGMNALKVVDEHNEVVIERVGGAQKGARGDLPGVKFRVVKVNGVALSEILAGRKEKPMR